LRETVANPLARLESQFGKIIENRRTSFRKIRSKFAMNVSLLSARRRSAPFGLPALTGLRCSSVAPEDRPREIHGVLRQIAENARNDHLQPFYSIRAVAEHFHVPAATVSRIYRQLSQERVLRTVWGSKTLLEPKFSENGECQAVGIPVNLSRFVVSIDYRAAVLSLQLELWNHEVIDHILFFDQQGDQVLHLCSRNHHPRIDAIIWLFPEKSHKQILLRLHDLGIRTICLSEQSMPGIPDCHPISDGYSIRVVVRKKILSI
jgi:DNA-binding transcriptional regulator YhcF (GntR family)